MKKLLELYGKVIELAKKTTDAKKIKELTKIGDEITALARSVKDPGSIAKEQLTKLSEDLLKLESKAIDQIDSGISKIDELEVAYGLKDKPSVTSRPQSKSAEMKDSIDRSIQYVAEKTGLSPDEARAAIMEKMNEGYEIGDPKRRGPKDLANLQAYLQVNLDYSPTNAVMFLEDIEEIAFSGAIDLASDTAKNVSKQEAKQIINSSNPGDEFGETLVDFDDANLQKAFDRVDNTPDEVLRKEQGPMTLEGTFEDILPERRAIMEEMYAPLIQERKIFEATQSEIQQTSAKIQDLVQQGRLEEAEALAESLKDFQKQLEIGDGSKAVIVPPDRTLNAMGGRIGIGSLFKRR
tara:strand:- start:2661 stop:3713 length:1053 start_codon:yes stop_codon:yes gene_type:complete